MAQLGMGVMIQMLCGDDSTGEAVRNRIGKTIRKVWLDEESDYLMFEFDDDTNLRLADGGQSCCEHRYMRTDDDLNEYAGAVLMDIEVASAPDQEDEWGEVHEVQFLNVHTDKGVFQMANHNEHNGYYGGFWIQASV